MPSDSTESVESGWLERSFQESKTGGPGSTDEPPRQPSEQMKTEKRKASRAELAEQSLQSRHSKQVPPGKSLQARAFRDVLRLY